MGLIRLGFDLVAVLRRAIWWRVLWFVAGVVCGGFGGWVGWLVCCFFVYG